MAALTLRHFDVLSYVEKARSLGVDERVASHQAREIEQAIEIATTIAKADIENKALATKNDIIKLERDIKEIELKIEQTKAELRTEIQKSKLETLIWVASMFMASGLIQHFFK